jgi:hypothetical protein
MDLSKLSTDDLMALRDGDLSRVSTPTLKMLRGGDAPAAPQKADPTEGVGRPEALMIAAGRTTDRVLDGITQLYLKAKGDDKALGGLAQNVKSGDAPYAALREKFPFVTGLGEALPMLVAPVGGGTAGAMIGRSALAAAAPEALSYGSGEERLKRAGVAGVSGAIGGAAGLAATRLLKPAGTAVQGVSDDALAAAQRIGFKPTPGQVTGNPAMQNFENYLSQTIGSSGRMLRHNQANEMALNRAGARAMGATADDLGEGVMAGAKGRMAQEFERLQQITGPDMARPEFMQALIKIDSANVARGPYASGKIAEQIDKALDLAAMGKISGKAYKEIHTELASASTAAFRGGDATLGQSLKSIREALDDAAKASLGHADQKAWDTVRRQWEAYKVLVKGNVIESGNVSAPRVASKLRNDPRFRTGELSGELADIARVGEAFKGVQNPKSGQLAKEQINTLFGALRAGGDAVAGAAYMSRPMQAYLTNGLPIGQNSRYLLNRGGGLLGAPAGAVWLGAE